jgi:putative Mg2+ transporter-C (MgtC) family protein
MLAELSTIESLARMGASIFCGAVLGFDRERKDKPAGLRTHAMVSMGSAAFTLVTLHLMRIGKDAESATTDPVHLIQGIVGGIGFLGAGTIIQSRGQVEGITTAASIWVAGAAGLACGIGEYALAAMTVGGAILVLEGLNIVKKRINPNGDKKDDGAADERR